MLVLDRDRDRPLREPEEEVGRAVERVDDPAQAGAARVVGALLPQEAVAGPRGRDAPEDQLLRRLVGRGHEVGRRALGLDLDRRAGERLQQLGARLARHPRGELEQLGAHGVAGGRWAGQSRSRSSWAATDSSTPSPSVRRDELHGQREAVAGEARGHRGGRLARVVEHRRVRDPAAVGVERPERRAAVVVHDLRRAAREQRHHDEVEAVGEDRRRAVAVLGLLRAGAGEHRVGDQRAHPHVAARAAREPLRVRQLGRLVVRRRAGSARGSCRRPGPTGSRARRPRGRASAAGRPCPAARRAARRRGASRSPAGRCG